LRRFKGSLNSFNDYNDVDRLLRELELNDLLLPYYGYGYNSINTDLNLILNDSLMWNVPVFDYWPWYYPHWLPWVGWSSSSSDLRDQTGWNTVDSVAWYAERVLRQLLLMHPDKVVWGLIKATKKAGNSRLLHYKIMTTEFTSRFLNSADSSVLEESDEPLSVFYTVPPNAMYFPKIAVNARHSPPSGKDLHYAVKVSEEAKSVVPFVRITEGGVYIYQTTGVHESKKIKNLETIGSELAFRLVVPQADMARVSQAVFTNDKMASAQPFNTPEQYVQAFRKTLGKLLTMHYHPYNNAQPSQTLDISGYRRVPAAGYT
jgi:hypothetical protein